MTIEKAIKYLEVWRECYRDSIDSCTAQAIGMAIEALNGADRPQGEWINRSLNITYPEWERYTCSVCGKHSYLYDYCPHCGARMRGADDE